MMSSEIVQDSRDLQRAPEDGSGLPGGARGGEPVPGDAWRQELAEELIGRARSEGVQLTGPGGLLTGITQMVLETALETELADHLGYDKGDPAGRGSPNTRNGHSAKTVHTDAGPVRIAIPRDRAGSFEPAGSPEARAAGRRVRHRDLDPVRQGPDHRRDPGAPGRGIRRRGVPGPGLQGHRRGQRRAHGVAEPAAGPDLRGAVRGRHHGQDPGRDGREPAGLRRGRRVAGRRPGRAGDVGRYRRGGRQAMARAT